MVFVNHRILVLYDSLCQEEYINIILNGASDSTLSILVQSTNYFSPCSFFLILLQLWHSTLRIIIGKLSILILGCVRRETWADSHMLPRTRMFCQCGTFHEDSLQKIRTGSKNIAQSTGEAATESTNSTWCFSKYL